MSMFGAFRPAPAMCSANVAAFASLSISTGNPNRSAMTCAKIELAEWDVDRAADGCPCAGRSGTEGRSRGRRRARREATRPLRPARRAAPPASRAAWASRDGAPRVPRGRRGPRGSSSRRGRPRSPVCSCATDNLTRRMPGEDKPYRVYRGGRQKGKVPLQTRSGRAAARARQTRTARRIAGPARSSSERDGLGAGGSRSRSCCSCCVIVAWAVAGYLSLQKRRREGQQAGAGRNRGGADSSGLADPVLAHEHPPARHRSLELAGARVAAFRLDHGHPHRSATSPHRVPLDPARPARADRGRRRHEDQRSDVSGRAAARDQDDLARTRACRSTT